MKQFLFITQVVVAVLLIAVILVQSRGTGFGRSWGSASSFTRRGLERIVFRLTFILSGIFILVSIIQLVI